MILSLSFGIVHDVNNVTLLRAPRYLENQFKLRSNVQTTARMQRLSQHRAQGQQHSPVAQYPASYANYQPPDGEDIPATATPTTSPQQRQLQLQHSSTVQTPPPSYDYQPMKRRDPYVIPAVPRYRAHDPYFSIQRKYTSFIHPVFEPDQEIFALFTKRFYYSDYRTVGATKFSDVNFAEQTRLVVKHFPLMHIWRRAEILSSILFATTGKVVPLFVEPPRQNRSQPDFYDAVIFAWVPTEMVTGVLSVSDCVLCDIESFIIEICDIGAGERMQLLAEYGAHVRDRLSQDQRHVLTEGLPHKPLHFEVSIR